MTADLLTAGLVVVELPSGATVRGVLPTFAELARFDLIPTHLRDAALHFADPAWLRESDAEAPARQSAWYGAVHLLVARFVREVRVGEAWEPVTVTPEALGTPERGGTMDGRDVDLLEHLVLRVRTSEQVTALSRLLRGETTGEAPADADLTPFRDGPDGAAAADDGAALADAAEPLAGAA